MNYCCGVTLHCVDVPAWGYMPPQASTVQMCPNWAPLHRRRGLNQAPAIATSEPKAQAQPHCIGCQNAPCCQKLSPLYVNMLKAEHFTRYGMPKCLVIKLWLLVDSFQVSIRLISDFIHIEHSSGKARLPFQTKSCCYTEASYHSRQYNIARAKSPFSEGFLFSLFISPVYPEVPFPLLLPCHPQQPPTRSISDANQMVFFSF